MSKGEFIVPNNIHLETICIFTKLKTKHNLEIIP